MSSLGRRGQVTLLAIVAALMLSACGGSSSSSSSKSSTSTAVASATTSTKAATKHGHAKGKPAKATKHSGQPARARTHAAAGAKPPSARRRGTPPPPPFVTGGVGTGFAIASKIFSQQVYTPITRGAPSRSTLRRAGGAMLEVRQALMASAQTAQRNPRTASLMRGLTDLARQSQMVFVALARGQNPTTAAQSFHNALNAMAARLKASGVKLS